MTQSAEGWTIPVCPECGERIVMAEDGHYHGKDPRFIHAERVRVQPVEVAEQEKRRTEELSVALRRIERGHTPDGFPLAGEHSQRIARDALSTKAGD